MGATHVYTAGGGAPGTVAASLEPWLTPVAPTLLRPTGVTQQGHPGVQQEEAPQLPGPGPGPGPGHTLSFLTTMGAS